MVKFILGRASSGKTYTVMQKIAECIYKGETPVLLVPEQFSFESEKNILDAVGDGNAQKVSVISFTRLCDEVERINGGVCSESITDSDRVVLMNRAIKNCRDDLVRFKKYVNSSSFARLMIDSINEFKLNFVSIDDLRNAADQIDDEQLKLKLLDTALIYENYDTVVSEKFIDNSDRLTKLYYALENYKYFENKTVFIDSFKSFSGQQYKIIERIIAQAKDVTIALTDNPEDTSKFGLFSNVKKVRDRILKMAGSKAVSDGENIILAAKNYTSPDLAALEEFMATGKTEFNDECNDITICCADSVYSEADFVARNIRRIVRESAGTVRYSDFVIIARDTAPYEDALSIACKKNDVSCFIDKRIPLINLPTATAVLSAANAALNFNTENILRFHKSGIDILTVDEIAELENYIYVWNIDGDTWQKEWTMNPDGFSAKEIGKHKQDILDSVEILRKKAIEPLIKLKADFKGNAQNMARALVRLLDDTNAAKRFKNLSKNYGDTNYADAVKQSWDSVMKILNSLCLCFGDSSIQKSEFCDALRMALSLESVGIIPQMIDEAVFGAADRIRPSRPKYAFIMGANHGVFPRIQQSEGLFVNSERQDLIKYNIDIPDKSLPAMIDEECLLYSNVCCASDGVFISYTATIDGTEAEPSAFIDDIQSNFKCKCFTEPSSLQDGTLPESFDDAFSLYCSSLAENNSDTKTLESLFAGSEYQFRADSVLQSRSKADYSISEETAKELFGNEIKMSASRLTTFGECRFKDFCKYGLNINTLEPVEYSNLQRGTFMHYILQRAVEEHGKGLSQYNEAQISDIVEQYAQEYLDMIVGYDEVETPHLKFLSSTVKRSAKYVVGRLASEFGQSDFIPVKCELRIGPDKKDENGNVIKKGDVPAVEIPIDNYGTLVLTGEIDRVDRWGDYVRIIDYKTGHKDFALPDILYGQNMQMLVYLYALLKSNKFGDKSAGILYMTAKRFKTEKPSQRRMNGLIVDDKAVATAMEKDNNGEYISAYPGRSNCFISDEEFEKIFEFVENKLKSAGEAIYKGDIAVSPVDGRKYSDSGKDDKSGACRFCEYQNICRIGGTVHEKVPKLTNAEVFEEIERQVGSSGIQTDQNAGESN